MTTAISRTLETKKPETSEAKEIEKHWTSFVRAFWRTTEDTSKTDVKPFRGIL